MLFGLACVLSTGAFAQDKGFGAGVVFGEPTGLSAKYWLDSKRAIDGGLAWSFHKKGFLHVHADLLWHFPEVIRTSVRLPLYAGIGGRIRFDDPVHAGVRIPVGIAWWVDGAPIDVFLEIVPILDLTPATEFELNGGIGVRYFF
jgi:hypothetical protein